MVTEILVVGLMAAVLLYTCFVLRKIERRETMEMLKTDVFPAMEKMTNDMMDRVMEKTVEMTKKLTEDKEY